MYFMCFAFFILNLKTKNLNADRLTTYQLRYLIDPNTSPLVICEGGIGLKKKKGQPQIAACPHTDN